MNNQSNPQFLTTKQLLERGWTKTLIKRFLPQPDGCSAVNLWMNFRGQDTYAVVKIWNVENTADFASAFLKSWRGRMKGLSPEDALAELKQQPHPEMQTRSKEEIARDTHLIAAAGYIHVARNRGLRTPHKC